jgi:hypothetical protein
VVTLPAGRGRPLGLAAPAPGPHRPGASNSVAGSTALLRIATCHGESPGYTCHARVGTLEQGTSEFDPFGRALSWKHVGASLRGTTTHCKVHVTPWRWRHQPTRHRSMRREPVSIQEDDKNRVLPLAHYQSLSVRLARPALPVTRGIRFKNTVLYIYKCLDSQTLPHAPSLLCRRALY